MVLVCKGYYQKNRISFFVKFYYGLSEVIWLRRCYNSVLNVLCSVLIYSVNSEKRSLKSLISNLLLIIQKPFSWSFSYRIASYCVEDYQWKAWIFEGALIKNQIFFQSFCQRKNRAQCNEVKNCLAKENWHKPFSPDKKGGKDSQLPPLPTPLKTAKWTVPSIIPKNGKFK